MPEADNTDTEAPKRPTVKADKSDAAKRPRPARVQPLAAQLKPRVEQRRDRRVRRGRLEIDATFDLHGLTQASADRHLAQFVASQRTAGARCLLVITGKGRDGEGVLRRNFVHWLEGAQARAMVASWAQAHPRHGGAGAFYLFLRR